MRLKINITRTRMRKLLVLKLVYREKEQKLLIFKG